MKQEEKCPNEGCSNLASPSHPCPYRQEIENDDDYRCACCKDCREQCERDI